MFKDLFTKLTKKLLEGLTLKKVLLIILGAAVCSFGIHNIHQRTAITEGGVIGMMLLIDRWLGASACCHHACAGHYMLCACLPLSGRTVHQDLRDLHLKRLPVL